MEFKELFDKANQIKEKYNQMHKNNVDPEWGVTEYTQGFVADVGKLMKLVMAKQGLYKVDDLDGKIKHELADCLYSVLVIASELDIDLEQEFVKTMAALDNKIKI